MRRLYLTIICMTLLFLRPLPVHADYLSDYEAPAHYTIQMDAGADPQTDGPVSIEANTSKNRYAAYLNVVENCIEQYGDTDSLDGPSYGMEHFTGLSFAKLIDFNDDGTEELFLVFYVRTNDVSESYENYVYIYNVWGYDGEQAVLLQDGNYLYGFNGGYQAVFFVENPFGTFFLHGCADSFQYDYYYGYEGDNFCLAKTLKQDEQYDESAKRMIQVYTVDGKSVSQNFYKEESALWGTTYAPSEKYVLTYSSEAERDKTYDMTYDTIVFLQQHSEELAITNEKGKTILHVQFHKPQKNPPVYSLIYKEFNTGTTKTIAQVQPPIEGDSAFDEEYTLFYDFSTDLQLESGSYQFYLLPEGADKDAEPFVVVSYRYDENEKFAVDDQYGNEREYRRLLSTESVPMKNADFVSNITKRLSNAGFSSNHIEKTISYIKNAPEPYRSLYLYSFYKYSFLEGNEIQFMPIENRIEITEKSAITVVEFYTALFHESGHGIDYHAGTDGYYTQTCAADEVLDAMKNDLYKAVDDQVSKWMKKNPDFVLCTQAELSEKIFDKLYSSDPEISREECPDFSGNEYKAYVFVEDQLRESMPGAVFTLDHGANGDMRDTFMGWTANKVAKELVGYEFSGHPISYWWNEDGNPTGHLLNEGWAEFYAAMFVNDEALIKSNESFFPLTCEVFKTMAGDMLSRLKSDL